MNVEEIGQNSQLFKNNVQIKLNRGIQLTMQSNAARERIIINVLFHEKALCTSEISSSSTNYTETFSSVIRSPSGCSTVEIRLKPNYCSGTKIEKTREHNSLTITNTPQLTITSD
eukprot:TRINITY_DN7768_c0_g2_i1.p2 TRINITY_DN7768_c0_g2~~TRINITY_DN7768_c0_g2_i1.p2  ORF type:complete len:115 (-),score=13.31 TRINITY_DN7768_c0_g2_i1:378-722(-)